MKKKTAISLSILSALLTSQSYAANPIIQFGEPHIVPAITKNAQGLTETQYIGLMTIKASPEQQKNFMNYNPKMKATINAALPPSATFPYIATMPVLDQGQHGSCVTFANTVAINALLGSDSNHRISQLCNLTLGSYFDPSMGLQAVGYVPSGWNGTFGAYVLEQIERFGAIPMMYQGLKACGGLAYYPVNSPNVPPPMTAQAFHPLSSNVMSSLDWTSILTYPQRFSADPVSPYNPVNVLEQVKTVIAANTPTKGTGRFVATIGFQLYGSVCSVGACAKHTPTAATNDTWALTPEITQQTSFPTDGHEVIVIGYDDAATAVDSKGNVHTGLLTLRNSWNTTMGDKGNYYMTYDYFMKYATEAQEIRTIPFQYTDK